MHGPWALRKQRPLKAACSVAPLTSPSQGDAVSGGGRGVAVRSLGLGRGGCGAVERQFEAALWRPLHCDCGGGWTRAWDAFGSAWDVLGGAQSSLSLTHTPHVCNCGSLNRPCGWYQNLFAGSFYSRTGAVWGFRGGQCCDSGPFNGGMAQTPGWGTKVMHAVQCGQKLKKENRKQGILSISLSLSVLKKTFQSCLHTSFALFVDFFPPN